MYEIPKPELLDADRVDRDDREDMTLEDHRSQSQLLAKALGESCTYAEQLWNQLDAVRQYLLDSLPPDPRAVPGGPSCASPAGPDDEAGWTGWMDTFAATTSVLCGAHGDSGFGADRARAEARARRDIPAGKHVAEVVVENAAAPTATTRGGPPSGGSEPRGQRAVADHDVKARHGRLDGAMKAAGLTLLGVLALRGLRGARPPAPRPRS